MEKIFRVLKFSPLIIVALVAFISFRMIKDRSIDYDVALGNTLVPKYETVEFPFEHEHQKDKSLPFAAGVVIDVDGDGVEEVFLGGGFEQEDALFRYKNEEFTKIEGILPERKSSDTSLGAIAFDTDMDGQVDLLVARESGIWLYANSGGKFSAKLLNAEMPKDTTPLSIAVADLNRDGKFDMYVSGYIRSDLVEGQNIFNKEGYGGTSILFINKGDNSFEDRTEEFGLFYKHNTFQGLFVDLDNDSWEDLVVAHDTGQVRTWKNQGGKRFVNMPNPNSEQYSYPMGIAASDYNNDGLVDLFFSNVGSTPPTFIVTGDLRDDQLFNRKWILFKNMGNFRFEDAAEETKLADYEFSWGAVFEDFNLDGRDDLVVSENYIGFPPHKISLFRLPGRLFVQTSTGEFAAVGKEAGITNSRFSISPLTADFNQDGSPDIVHVNIGGVSKAFISKERSGNFLKVILPNNIRSVGAKVIVEKDNGEKIYQSWIIGEGLCSDSSHVLVFGLGNQAPKRLEVHYLDGRKESKDDPSPNSTVTFEQKTAIPKT